MPSPEDLVRLPKPNSQTLLLVALLGVGGASGLGANAKLDTISTTIARVEGSVTELRAKVEATERLSLDTRMRVLEQIGSERRLETVERDIENLKGKK